MKAVENDEDWYMSYTRKETGECIYKTVKARDLFEVFCKANYDYGEPGLLYWDRIKNYNMLSTYEDFEFAGINPCGELPLPNGGACLLGSLNLAEFVKDGCFDYDDFGTAVKHAISALDVVQTEGIKYLPLEIQRKTAEEWRQLGLGIMGLGDMLIKMNIKYGSEESIELCERIGKIMAINAILESGRIGAYRKHFDKFDSDKTTSSPFWIANAGAKGCIMRNSQLLAIAPTGTISTMLGVSGGIEPLFALEYERTTKSLHGEDVKYTVIPDVVKEAREKGFTNGLVCAQDIPYQDRIAMQAVWQKHIDGSISSTINLPNDFPEDQVKDIYMLAWKSGLKGITVFRDGCKRAGILNTVNKEEVKLKDVDSVNLIGKKRKLMTGCGSLHCTAFFDKETGKFYELYLSKGSTGGCNNFMIGLSRMVSLSARSGCTVDEIIDQLNSCGACPSYAVRKATKGDTSIGSCCPTAVGFALKEMQEEMFAEIGKGSVKVGKPVNQIITINTNDNPCPQCGAKLSFTNGCATCMACGYSKCN
jgi:ribonucleoside-diphosphate reductase alpha chain